MVLIMRKGGLCRTLLALLVAAVLCVRVLRADRLDSGRKAFEAGDYQRALRQLKPLAERGDPQAQRFLGIIYRFGYSVSADLNRAVEWFRRSASKGDVYSQSSLGFLFALTKKYEEAASYYYQAAKQGDAEAQLQLGLYYALGQGVAKSDTEALKWLEMACDRGNDTIALLAGEALDKGLVLPRNGGLAAKCFTRANKQGNLIAAARLGMLRLTGEGEPADFGASLRLFRAAAAGDVGEAYYGLGLMYERGLGMVANQPEAAEWYRKAARMGVPQAQVALGRLYEQGIGVPRDYSEAIAHYSDAARRGLAEAQYILGQRYFEGKITAQDKVKAYMMLNIAAASNHPDAHLLRDVVAGSMTLEQIASAQRLSRDWLGESTEQQPSGVSGTSFQGFTQVRRGSGFFVNDSGYLLTADHVVCSCRLVAVGVDGQWVPAQVVAEDARQDLAAIKIPKASGSFARFRSKGAPLLGLTVFVAGYPLPQFLAGTLNITSGTLSSLGGLGGDSAAVQISAPVQPGNSGGPVLDGGANVVGIASEKLIGAVIENVGFAIKREAVWTFLDTYGIRYFIGDPTASLDSTEVAQVAGRWTAPVSCWQ